MAKILTFRNKDGAASDQDFLTDANQTLSFRMSDDGGVSLGGMSQGNLPGPFPDPKKDWSNQELADLFRVRQLLSGANVPVETDRGVTDEGDPWFVFCHASGEVFIHLCRIDGVYVLDSPNVQRPLRGADFNGLIADFTNQALPAQDGDETTERRVIRLERGGKIRLHPSAMLAALIWTLFLASEELVLLAPEETEADSDALLDFDGIFAVDDTDADIEDLLFQDDTIDVASLIKDDTHETDHAGPEFHSQIREALSQQQQGLTAQQNAFTMGLSTIAIAMGFMSETVLLDSQRKVLDSLKKLGVSDYTDGTQQVADLDLSADADGALLAMLADFLGLDLSLNTDLAEIPADKAQAAELDSETANLTGNVIIEDTADVSVQAHTPRSKDKSDDIIDQADAPREAPKMPLTHSDSEAASAEVVVDVTTLSQLIETWQPEMKEYQFGETMIKVSLGSLTDSTDALFDWLNTATTHSDTYSEEAYNSAQQLIDFMKARDGDLYIMERDDKIVMVNMAAVTGGGTATAQWETPDGQIIYLVGLQSDIEQFDMIA